MKKSKKTSITYKMGIALSLLIIFLMSAVSAANYLRTKYTLENQVLDKGWSIVSTGIALTREFLYSGSPISPVAFLANIKAVPNVNYAMVIDQNGKILANTDPAVNGQNSGMALTNKPRAQKYSDKSGNPGIEFISPVTTPDGRILGYFALGLNTSNDETMLNDILFNMIFISSAAVIAGIFLAMVLTRRILKKPINDLMQATEHIAVGDFAHQVKIHDLDELGSLSTAFNTMTGHLANLFRSVQISAAEITKSSQIIISRTEDFKQSLEDKPAAVGEQAAPDGAAKRQAETLQEITSTVRRMARLVDRLNSLSLQFKV
ncbi:MAG: HAMP domain-containing protein [Firmicutes bacterium]|nr:HAMP domain-containing protein [Bacillota bacterium]